MRLFVDTEFTDLLDCELLSIGIVSEDGREFYGERSDVDLARCGDFGRVAVLPQLGQDLSVDRARRHVPGPPAYRAEGLVLNLVDQHVAVQAHARGLAA